MPVFQRSTAPTTMPVTINLPVTQTPQQVNVPAPVPQQPTPQPSGPVVGEKGSTAAPTPPPSTSRRSIVVPVVRG